MSASDRSSSDGFEKRGRKHLGRDEKAQIRRRTGRKILRRPPPFLFSTGQTPQKVSKLK